MQRRMNALWFRLMALEYRVKTSAVLPTLVDAGIRRGMRVLDFGCGPGRYALPAAELVGGEGAVFAADIHPLAIMMVQRGARQRSLLNVHAMRTDCATGLPPGSIDMVLLYDALHDVVDKDSVLRELRRVLVSDGRIQYKDHTLSGMEVVSLMRASGFCPAGESTLQITFARC